MTSLIAFIIVSIALYNIVETRPTGKDAVEETTLNAAFQELIKASIRSTKGLKNTKIIIKEDIKMNCDEKCKTLEELRIKLTINPK